MLYSQYKYNYYKYATAVFPADATVSTTVSSTSADLVEAISLETVSTQTSSTSANFVDIWAGVPLSPATWIDATLGSAIWTDKPLGTASWVNAN